MKKPVRCSWCLSLKTHRWGTRKVQGRSIQKFKCLCCGHIFSGRLTKGHLSGRAKAELTRRHLEGRTSIRQLIRDTGHSSHTILSAIHQTVDQTVSTAWVAGQLRPNWGGQLAVDGTVIRVWDWSAKYFRYSKEQRRFLHKMVWLVALDLQTLDIVHHHLADEESMIDLILFYQQVQKNGYPLKGLVSDGNPDIRRAAQRVFGDSFDYQQCVRHYLEKLRRDFRDQSLSERQYVDLTLA